MEKHIDINNPIGGYYRPGLYDVERLALTTTGRQDIISEFLVYLTEQLENEKDTHFLISGLDGLGKTHLLKILGRRIETSEEFAKKAIVVRFPVDSYFIQSTASLCLELLRLLGEITGEICFNEKKAELSDVVDDQEIVKEVASLISGYTAEKCKYILVLYDNINQFIRISAKSADINKDFSKLLSLLEKTLFIATYNATYYFSDKKAPSLKHFCVSELNKFTESQTIELIRKNLEWEEYSELLSNFTLLLPKIKALHRMSGGSPRLIMLLYALVVNEARLDIKKLFEQILDQVSPFFYSRINNLNQFERAIISTIARGRGSTVTQTRLVKETRISQQQCSTALNKLIQYDLIEARENPEDKRSKVYSITEGFFDLWLAIGQSREPKNFLPLLGEFIQYWYAERKNREVKKQRIWEELSQLRPNRHKSEIENNEILLEYLSELGDANEIVQSNLELAVYHFDKGNSGKADLCLNHVRLQSSLSLFNDWMFIQVERLTTVGLNPDMSMLLKQIFTAWSFHRLEDLINLLPMAAKISDYFVSQSLHSENILFLEEIIDPVEISQGQLSLMANIAVSYEKIGQPDKAIQAWNLVSIKADETEDLKTKGTAYNNISQIYQDQKNYDQALSYLEWSLDISKKINDLNGQSSTLNNIATIHFSQGFYEKALEYLNDALLIVRGAGNMSVEAVTLSNIALIFQVRGDFDKALNYLENSLSLMRLMNNSHGECTALMNLSQVYFEMDQGEFAYETMALALETVRSSLDHKEIFEVLLKMIRLCIKIEKKELAYSYLIEARTMSVEHGLAIERDELSLITQRIGITEYNEI